MNRAPSENVLDSCSHAVGRFGFGLPDRVKNLFNMGEVDFSNRQFAKVRDCVRVQAVGPLRFLAGIPELFGLHPDVFFHRLLESERADLLRQQGAFKGSLFLERVYAVPDLFFDLAGLIASLSQ